MGNLIKPKMNTILTILLSMNHFPVESSNYLPVNATGPADKCYTLEELAYVTKQMRDRCINKFYIWTMLATADKDGDQTCLKPRFWEQKFEKDHGETNLILNRHDELMELKRNNKLYLFSSLESCCRCSSHMTWWARNFDVDFEVVATGIDESMGPRKGKDPVKSKNDACHWKCTELSPAERARYKETVYKWYDDVNYNLLPGSPDESYDQCFAATLPQELDYALQTKNHQFKLNWTKYFGTKEDEKPWAVGYNINNGLVKNNEDVKFIVSQITKSTPAASELVQFLSYQMHAKDPEFKRLSVPRFHLDPKKVPNQTTTEVPKMNQIRCQDISKIKFADFKSEEKMTYLRNINEKMKNDLEDERIITMFYEVAKIIEEVKTDAKQLKI